MIARLCGKLLDITDNVALIDVSGVGYDVHVPPYAAEGLNGALGDTVTLHTYCYIVGGNVGNGLPTLIGFASMADREFFERFITVSGVGPKAAVKALILRPGDVALAIEREDVKTLKGLPGIGERTAREIIATLKGKVMKFAASSDPAPAGRVSAGPSGFGGTTLEDEAVAVLEQLGYRRAEAERMVKDAMARLPGVAKVEDLIQEVYRHGTGVGRA